MKNMNALIRKDISSKVPFGMGVSVYVLLWMVL